jgi:hypothetical protein
VAKLEIVEKLNLWIIRNSPDMMHWEKWWVWDGQGISNAYLKHIALNDGIECHPDKTIEDTLTDMMFEMYLDRAIHLEGGRVYKIPLARYIWTLPFLEVVD